MSLVVDVPDIVAESNDPLLSKHDSWARVPLGGIARILNGFAFPSAGFNPSRGMPLIRIRDVGRDTTSCFYEGDYPAEYVVMPGDLLVGMDGEFRAARWRGAPALLNQRVCKIEVDATVYMPRFLDLVLPAYLAVIHARTSSQTVKHLSSRSITEIPLPLPPVPEQRRIVDRLELLLSKLDLASDRFDRITEVLSRLRQSVLAAACSGRLTEDWRGSHVQKHSAPHQTDLQPWDLPYGWYWTRFKGLIQSIRMGTTVPPTETSTPFPVLRSSSVRPMMLDLDDVKYLQKDESRNPANFLREDDLLFTRLSGSLAYVANCARVRNLGDRRIQFPDRLFCVRLTDPTLAPYIELCFANPLLRSNLTISAKSSAGHQRVSTGAITGFPIPVPPPEERAQILARISRLMQIIGRTEKRLASQATSLVGMRSSILSRAFRGELVPTEAELAQRERRSYETAEELLQRIGRHGLFSEGARRQNWGTGIRSRDRGDPPGGKRSHPAT